MLKTFKEWLESKSVGDWSAQTVEEKARLQKEYMQYVSETLKDFQASVPQAATEEEKTAQLEETIKSLMAAEEMKNFETRIQEVEEKALQILENSKNELTKSFAEQVKEQILSKKDEWKALKEDKNANLSFTIKAPADMLITTNTTGRVARYETDPERVGIARRNPFMLELVNTGATTSNTIYWVERFNHEGTPTFVAEGAAKPQVDWEYIERSAPTRKIAAFTKVSKEMMDDVDNIAQDIALELTEQIMLFSDEALITGDGSGVTLLGVDENATPFAPGSVLLNSVDGANDMDVLRAAVAQVFRANFIPNRIVVNPDKLASMEMEKGDDGHYIMPPFIAADGSVVAGIRVTANNGVAGDSFRVGDFNKFKVKIREGISIQVGYDGNDWTNNMITPLAEMRLASYIASNNFGAIVAGTFTVGKALLDPTVADS